MDEIAQKIMDAGQQHLDGEPIVEQVKSVIESGQPGDVSARPTEISPSIAIGSVNEGDSSNPGASESVGPAQKFKDNDYLVKAGSLPPRDPDGLDCLHKDLMILKLEVIQILSSARDKCIDWLYESKTQYSKKV